MMRKQTLPVTPIRVVLFDENLRRYVNETRAKGGIPVLFNSIVRRNFVQPKDAAIAKDVRRTPGEKEQPKEGTVLFDTHGAYLDAPPQCG